MCSLKGGTALTSAEKSYRFHIVTEPMNLAEEKSKELTGGIRQSRLSDDGRLKAGGSITLRQGQGRKTLTGLC
jgi:hypothetical protein